MREFLVDQAIEQDGLSILFPLGRRAPVLGRGADHPAGCVAADGRDLLGLSRSRSPDQPSGPALLTGQRITDLDGGLRGRALFPDEMFADLFTDVGRRSVPPMIVAVVMMLQRSRALGSGSASALIWAPRGRGERADPPQP
jgi:hypothetical protein